MALRRRGLRQKHGNACATKEDQRGRRCDAASVELPRDFHNSTSVVQTKAFVRGFPCGKRVRWLGWSRLTDLAQRQVCQADKLMSNIKSPNILVIFHASNILNFCNRPARALSSSEHAPPNIQRNLGAGRGQPAQLAFPLRELARRMGIAEGSDVGPCEPRPMDAANRGGKGRCEALRASHSSRPVTQPPRPSSTRRTPRRANGAGSQILRFAGLGEKWSRPKF